MLLSVRTGVENLKYQPKDLIMCECVEIEELSAGLWRGREKREGEIKGGGGERGWREREEREKGEIEGWE